MRVGTSKSSTQRFPCLWDHPHACGDKQTGNFDMPVIQGSSPCVWGQVRFKDLECKQARIIPMRVGTSIYADTDSIHCEDHPHACGDKSFLIL